MAAEYGSFCFCFIFIVEASHNKVLFPSNKFHCMLSCTVTREGPQDEIPPPPPLPIGCRWHLQGALEVCVLAGRGVWTLILEAYIFILSSEQLKQDWFPFSSFLWSSKIVNQKFLFTLPQLHYSCIFFSLRSPALLLFSAQLVQKRLRAGWSLVMQSLPPIFR